MEILKFDPFLHNGDTHSVAATAKLYRALETIESYGHDHNR